MKVQLKHVSLAYPLNNVALSDVDLCIEAGERVVILGASGSGKTSLLRVIAGLEPVTHGEVLIGGRDCTAAPPNARGVAMAFQSPALYPHFTVAENLAAGKTGAGRNPARNAEIRELAELLDIHGLLDRYPAQLSGGQKARAALGRALASGKSIVLLDEPFSGLDSPLRAAIREMLLETHWRKPFTLIFVSHDLDDANTIGERLVILDAGKVVQQGISDLVASQPATWTVATLISRIPWNRFDLRVARRGDRYVAVPGQMGRDGESVPSGIAWHPSWEGYEVVAGIRPESMRMTRPAESSEAIESFAGKWVRNEGAGADRLAVFEHNGLVWRARQASAEKAIEESESNNLYVFARDIHWFEKNTGNRIDPDRPTTEQS